ncbi:MAG: epoxyqueuosine reductase QueH [Patescibacteria group bacterium]
MPRLLLHTCCVVCSSHVLDVLRREYQVTAYFYNSNIEPVEEYERRRDTTRERCEEIGLPFVEGPAGHNHWAEAVRGFEHEPEGGARCLICWRLRLEEAARYAKENGFEVFATTLTMGRNKKAEVINPLGQQAGEKYSVKFYEADWKKGGGQEAAYQLAKEHNFYRQNYCGCSFNREKKIPPT